MIRGSALSITLHGLLLAAVLFGLPRLFDVAQDDPAQEPPPIAVTVVKPEQAKAIEEAATRPLAEIEASAGGRGGLMADALDTETPHDRRPILQSATASSDLARSATVKADERTPSTDPVPTRDAAEKQASTASRTVVSALKQSSQPSERQITSASPASSQSSQVQPVEAETAPGQAIPSRAPTQLPPPHVFTPPQAASPEETPSASVPTMSRSAASAMHVAQTETPQAAMQIATQPSSAAAQLADGDAAARALAPLVAALPRIDDSVTKIVAAQFRDEAAAKAAAQGEPAMRSAIVLLESAAEQGYAEAQFDLAEIYLTGDGRPRDVTKGAQYLQRASVNGYVPAQLLSAALAVEGSVVPRDLAEAQAWLAAAADKGSVRAAEAVKRLAPQLTARDDVRARQRRSQLRQIFVLTQPKPREQTVPPADELLRVATTLGDAEAVYVQLTQGADPDKPDQDGRTASIEAAWRGYVKILGALLEKGANAQVTDASGKTPLIWAAVNGQVAVVERLLAAKVFVDTQDREGVTALMRAAWNGHADVVRLLLQGNANSRLRDRSGKSALDYAKLSHDAETLQLLQASRT
ncbi:MAG TPA: ankyrin repeat domain-containing protein [Alphaproteobacteria bacterium]